MQFDHTLIRASAGTGKTYQLTNRYLALVNSGIPPEQVLASTFTRKAAGEILERIVVRLAQAATLPRAGRDLAEALGDELLTSQRCLDLLERLTRNLHRLRISTLDSFFAQVATSFSLELGLPPGWRITEDHLDAQIRSAAIELVLQADSQEGLSRLMNLLAKGEAERSVSELVRSAVNDLYTLFLETDAPAWHQFPEVKMLDRVSLDAAIQQLRDCQLPEDKRFESARQRDLDSALEGDWDTFIKRGLAAKVLDGDDIYYRKPIPATAVAVYERLLEHAKAFLIDQLAKQTGATYELLEKFDRVYRRLKHDTRSYRFEDVTYHLSNVTMMANVEQQEFRLDAPLAHLLLDEFQDTSLIQWRVLRPIAERIVMNQATTGSLFWLGGQKSFFCVGDVKQAIYGWRGGQAEIFEALESQLPGLHQVALNRSYRSAQPVIDVVNRIFTRIDRHPNLDNFAPAVERWVSGFSEHTTARHELAGHCTLETARRADEFEEQIDVTLMDAARRVQELAEQAPGRSIGVLVRRNAIVARLIYLLRQIGVRASEEGGNPLSDSVAVQVVLSALELADHPGNTIARYHLACSPLGGVLEFQDHQDDQRSSDLAASIRRDLATQGYGPVLYRWSQWLMASSSQRDQNRLQQLVNMAYIYNDVTSLRPLDFVSFIRKQRVADPTSASVRVMTIHQAKGLEFDIVVLPDLEAQLVGQHDACVSGQPDPAEPVDRVCLYRNMHVQSLLPESLRELFEHAIGQAVTEALCVLYVAVTRPVHALHMIIPPSTEDERSLHKTPAGLIRAALAESDQLPQNAVVFEHGDPRWFEGVSAHAPSPLPIAEIVAPDRIRLADSLESPQLGLDRQSPSGLEGGFAVAVEDLLRLDNSIAMLRGTLIHAWFEQVEWLDDGYPSQALLQRVANELDTTGLDVPLTMAQFQDMLQDSRIVAALSRRAYCDAASSLRVEVHNERRFAVRDHDRILSGTIDRLVLVKSDTTIVAADIVDFKTDAVDPRQPATIDAAVDHYAPQLEAYRTAVSKMFQVARQKVTARLVFVGPAIIRSVGPANDKTAEV